MEGTLEKTGLAVLQLEWRLTPAIPVFRPPGKEDRCESLRSAWARKTCNPRIKDSR